jgi:carboxyl-terminal processing protease
VRLTVARAQQAPFEVALTRAVIRLRLVKSTLQAGAIGYLRVTLFSEQTQPQTLAALDQLKRRLAGLVLDLRNDPGGRLDAAVAVAGDFLDGGTVVRFAPWRGRRAANDNGISAPIFGDRLRGTPIVVLINNGTASASEIVAGALQDHRRARILGTRSFGKGTVQSVFALDGHGALRVTTAEYRLPSGRSIQARGITPDRTVLPDEVLKLPAGAKIVNEAQLLGTHADPIEPTVDPGVIGTARDSQLAAALQELRAGAR